MAQSVQLNAGALGEAVSKLVQTVRHHWSIQRKTESLRLQIEHFVSPCQVWQLTQGTISKQLLVGTEM